MMQITRRGQPITHIGKSIRTASMMVDKVSTVSQLTRDARQAQELTQKAFVESICENLFGIELSYKVVNHWESGRQTPGYILLYAVLASYRDWRHDWALGCLEVLRPDIWVGKELKRVEE